MTAPDLQLELPDEDSTIAFARRIGAVLETGDILLLQGDIGAGKSFFARALIQSLQEFPEHVPSPTFTLVQTYDTRKGEIWHADLYRLSTPDEAFELGLIDAFETAICLIEWPDRLGDTIPRTANLLEFTLPGDGETRLLTMRAAPRLVAAASLETTNV